MSRDYNLDPGAVKSRVDMLDGGIGVDEFYWRWFEYGTVKLQAMPFIRPGYRAMRKTFWLRWVLTSSAGSAGGPSMTVVLQEDALQEYIVDYLSADATLMGMCNGEVAPEAIWGTNASPFVRIDRLDGADVLVIGLTRVLVDATYHIRGCEHWRGMGRPDRSSVNAIGARIDVLLHKADGNDGAYRIASWREEPEPNPALVEADGELWLQSGGIYRFQITAP